MRARLQTHATTDRTRPVLVWRSPTPFLACSSASFGGGMAVRSWIANAQVPKDYDRTDLAAHAGELQADLQLSGDGVLLLTATAVDEHTTAADGEVSVTATVGLSLPTWAAATDDEGGLPIDPSPGTINIVAWLPVRLSLSALVGAVVTVTEAKVQALLERGVHATGTASDAVCVACPTTGSVEPFAGPRSPWGSRLARAVHEAVSAGCP